MTAERTTKQRWLAAIDEMIEEFESLKNERMSELVAMQNSLSRLEDATEDFELNDIVRLLDQAVQLRNDIVNLVPSEFTAPAS